MRIAIINPNTTAVFTERLRRSAETVAATGTEIIAVNPSSGTPSVESHVDEAIASIGVIEAMRMGEAAEMDGYVVACFGDTGVMAAREIARGPVVGMTEAALFTAAMLAARFSIITLPPRTIVHSRRVVHEYGFGHKVGGIRAIDVDVADAEDEEAALLAPMLEEARVALRDDAAEAIVLGCAGVSSLVDPMASALGVPVIDGVAAALKMVEGYVRLGLRTSKALSYGFPPVRSNT